MKRGFAIQTRRKPKSIQRIFSTVIMSFPDTKTIHHMFNSVTEMLTEAFSSIWVKASVRRWQQSVQLKISYVAKSPTSREINVKEIYRMFSSKAWFNFRWNHSLVINKLCGRGRKSITEMSSIFIIHNSHRLALGISSCRCVYDQWSLIVASPNSKLHPARLQPTYIKSWEIKFRSDNLYVHMSIKSETKCFRGMWMWDLAAWWRRRIVWGMLLR